MVNSLELEKDGIVEIILEFRLSSDFLIQTNFLTIISINLFYCWEGSCSNEYISDWEKFNETLK